MFVGLLGRGSFIQNVVMIASMLWDEDQIFPSVSPEVFFYDDVTVESCLKLQQEIRGQGILSRNIRQQLKLSHYPPIDLHIQSDGGILSSALNVCDFIESFDLPVHTYIEGSVASSASLIAVCGDRRFMTKRSTLLIHEPSTDLGVAKQSVMQDEAHNMNLLCSFMVDIYTSRSKLQRKQVLHMIQNEKYLNASECLRFGLVDEII